MPFAVPDGVAAAVRWQEPSTAALTSRSGTGSAQGGTGGARRTVSNWPLLWERLRQDSEGPELVWHSRAREELLSALLAELEALEEAGSHRPASRSSASRSSLVPRLVGLAHSQDGPSDGPSEAFPDCCIASSFTHQVFE
jgi:hypothetical protein